MAEGTNGDSRNGRDAKSDPTLLTTELTLREINNLKELIEGRLRSNEIAVTTALDAAKNISEQLITSANKRVDQLQALQDERFNSIDTQFAEREQRYESQNDDNRTAVTVALQAVKEAVTEQNKTHAFRISQLQELHDEKFRSIGTQFSERDIRTEQTSRDSKVAVDAALQAAKEAVGEQNKSSALAIAKSEASTTKQIDQIGLIINSMAKNFDDKIDDMKTRLTTIEGMRIGGNYQIEGTRSERLTQATVWGYVVGGFGVLIAVVTLILLISKHV
jgi:cation transport regulator ChaB